MSKKITLKDLDIKMVSFPDNQYLHTDYEKVQIYLHHTAGNSDGGRVFSHWAKTETRVATCVCISGKGANSGDGKIIQGFSSRDWAYHLGLKSSTFKSRGIPYKSLDKISIGIEICNFGYLKKDDDGNFRTYVDSIIPKEDVIELKKPYRGYKYWHNYTDAQIESVRKLLLYWNDRYGIPLDYNEDVWDITDRALKGEKGIFTHNSVRTDKRDIYPHPKLIKMWKSLTAKAPAKKATPAKKKAVTSAKAASKKSTKKVTVKKTTTTKVTVSTKKTPKKKTVTKKVVKPTAKKKAAKKKTTKK
jgi:N-acetyl-anhydromuramyl-L-alanine amidase AmpD